MMIVCTTLPITHHAPYSGSTQQIQKTSRCARWSRILISVRFICAAYFRVLIFPYQGIQLEELYWHHVEFFPCHPAICFSLKLEELTDALIQGRAGTNLQALLHCHYLINSLDGLMSTVSTFPYDASECAQFLELIKTVKGEYVQWGFGAVL